MSEFALIRPLDRIAVVEKRRDNRGHIAGLMKRDVLGLGVTRNAQFYPYAQFAIANAKDKTIHCLMSIVVDNAKDFGELEEVPEPFKTHCIRGEVDLPEGL